MGKTSGMPFCLSAVYIIAHSSYDSEWDKFLQKRFGGQVLPLSPVFFFIRKAMKIIDPSISSCCSFFLSFNQMTLKPEK